ncbi:MAG: S-layer homology domain-containing protein [Bacillota bacterium]
MRKTVLKHRSALFWWSLVLLLLLLAGLWAAGVLPFFRPEETVAPSVRNNAPTAAAGGNLYVAVPPPGDPRWPARLRAAGGEVGDPTGDGGYLVRLPEEEAARLTTAGFKLNPYPAGRRLAPGSGKAGIYTLILFQEGDKEAVARLVRGAGGEVLAGLAEEGRALRVRLPAGGAARLATAPHVLYIEPYRPPELFNDRAADIVGAAPLTVPGFAVPEGLTGAGQIVALADSGLDRGRPDDLPPDFAAVPGKMPKVAFLKAWGDAGPADPVGHGTHMAGTIAGTGAASGGKFRGLAPGAALYVQSILNREKNLVPPADLAALFRPALAAGAYIHVDGWGAGENAYRGSAAQVDRFVRLYPEFLPVFGAGNDGPGAGSISAEANSKNALVVGASQSVRPGLSPDAVDAGQPAGFSSRGPAADGRIKPDLVAPGTGVISTASRLVGGNFLPNRAYSRMQGTSVAAAVAGGAAALLREYFVREEGMARPSAALLKAALINGARPLGAAPEAEGFGRLDLACAVLPLREGTVRFVDERAGLGAGEELLFRFEAAGPGPVSVTLAWTDPAAAPGAARALVNNLDLVVTGPGGKRYLGNDFAGRGRADEVNNVERVYIPDPQPGTYTVTVRGTAVTAPAVPGAGKPAQDFALVYGQLPEVAAVRPGSDRGVLALPDGTVLNPPAGRTHVAVNGRAAPLAEVPPGADAYLFGSPAAPAALYLAGRTWQGAGVQVLDFKGYPLLLEINVRAREGGYPLLPGASLSLNGETVREAGAIPPGATVAAAVNPASQTVAAVRAGYAERDGFIAAVDADAGTVRLLGDPTVYSLAPAAAVSFQDVVEDASWADAPFGMPACTDTGAVVPGMAVRLMLDPATLRPGGENRVVHLAVKRRLALGTVVARRVGDAGEDELVLDTGQSFRIPAGIAVTRDGAAAHPADIRPGDHAALLLLPGTRDAVAVEASSRVVYGRILFVGEAQKSIYLIDHLNQFRIFPFVPPTSSSPPPTAVFRWGLATDLSAVHPGDWVRATLTPEGAVGRLDVAEIAGEMRATFAGYDAATGILRAGGREYRVSPRTLLVRGGFAIGPEDLVRGEKIDLTALAVPAAAGPPVLAAVRAATPPGPGPDLEAYLLPQGGVFLVAGKSDADRVYVYREDGTRLQAARDPAGRFVVALEREDAGKDVDVVAMDAATGAMAVRSLNVPRVAPAAFGDIGGHWAEEVIRALGARGVLQGYPDGTFRPERPVTRAEFVVLVVRALGWRVDPSGRPAFGDAGAIPAWARPYVAAAQENGLVNGDGRLFRPQAGITRVEAASLLVRVLTRVGLLPAIVPDPAQPDGELPFRDAAALPAWARADVARAHAAGLVRGYPDGRFAPQAPVTRAEAATLLYRATQR